ncbi:ICT1-like protein [Mya arenaria]|uniref:Large ribosomal subunit protein mL62 n=1 Tax=Mya arenaria TaxID=6604 RepID=A0ABY7DIM2_MYAAR|nr:peptidyl-tRNA hydrolase ICT1, mitochondrial-like [Mya arenaria]WAQ96456.1 ICT1-like protein [Mya arenaria]
MFSLHLRNFVRLEQKLIQNHLLSRNSSFKSGIALDKLYEKSDNHPTSSEFSRTDSKSTTEDGLAEQFTGEIPIKDISIQSCRSSGPGGQHVNKVNTKVEVRFNVNSATWIPEWVKPKLLEEQQNRVTKNGELIVTSEKTRKQILNQADCLDKIRHMIFQASRKPKELTPYELELIAKREEAAKKRNIEDKRRRSLLKMRRRGEFF